MVAAKEAMWTEGEHGRIARYEWVQRNKHSRYNQKPKVQNVAKILGNINKSPGYTWNGLPTHDTVKVDTTQERKTSVDPVVCEPAVYEWGPLNIGAAKEKFEQYRNKRYARE